MKAFRLAGTAAAAVALVFTSALTAQAGEQASGTVKAPYKSGNKVYAEATLHGPNPVGTKLCVYLNAQHPFTPDVTISSKCVSLNAGTVKVSAPVPACGNYTTWAAATYNGRTTWQKSTGYVLFCK